MHTRLLIMWTYSYVQVSHYGSSFIPGWALKSWEKVWGWEWAWRDEANTWSSACERMYLKSWFRGSCLLCPVSDILHPHADDVGVSWLVNFTLSSRVTLQHGLEKVKVILHCWQLHAGRMYSCRSREYGGGRKGERKRERGREGEREREREKKEGVNNSHCTGAVCTQ